jgi:hypothetical protein
MRAQTIMQTIAGVAATGILVTALISVAAGDTAPPAPSASPAASVTTQSAAADAESLVRELAATHRNAWSWRQPVVRWQDDGDGPAEVRATSGAFVAAVLRRAFHLSADDGRKLWGDADPDAERFELLIERSQGGFSPLAAGAIQPGDVIASRVLPGATGLPYAGIVDDVPRPVRGGGDLGQAYDLKVIDVAMRGHGSGDTRLKGASGAGVGTLRFFVSSNGDLSGYAWSAAWPYDPGDATFQPSSDRPVAVGRFSPVGAIPFPKPTGK